jgi:hypothetical protein
LALLPFKVSKSTGTLFIDTIRKIFFPPGVGGGSRQDPAMATLPRTPLPYVADTERITNYGMVYVTHPSALKINMLAIESRLLTSKMSLTKSLCINVLCSQPT